MYLLGILKFIVCEGGSMIYIHGNNIYLKSFSLNEYHSFYLQYEPDPLMDCKEYIYDKEDVDARFEKMKENRAWYPRVGIFLKDNSVIGELSFKRIDYKKSRCDLGIVLVNDKYKGQGYGSEAVDLAINFAFRVLKLNNIYGDTTSVNIRMKSIFSKYGFQRIDNETEESDRIYYVLHKDERERHMIKNIISRDDFVIDTDRLRMSPIEKSYAEILLREFDSGITKYQYPDPYKDIEEVYKFIDSAEEERLQGRNLILTIENRDNEFIGNIEIYGLHTSSPEIGLWIKRDKQHQGYGMEAIKAVMDFCKKNMTINYFIYEADKRNPDSIHLVDKLGGIKKEFNEYKTDSGKVLQLDLYNIY